MRHKESGLLLVFVFIAFYDVLYAFQKVNDWRVIFIFGEGLNVITRIIFILMFFFFAKSKVFLSGGFTVQFNRIQKLMIEMMTKINKNVNKNFQ